MTKAFQLLKDAVTLKNADIPDKELFFDFVKKNKREMEDVLLKNIKIFEGAFCCKHTFGLALFLSPFSICVRHVGRVDEIINGKYKPERLNSKSLDNAKALKGNMLFQVAHFIGECVDENLTASDKRVLKSLLQDAIAKCDS